MALMVSTGLLTALLARIALRAQSEGRGALSCVLFGAVLGAVNVGLSLAILECLEGDVLEAMSMLFFGSLMGIVVGAPVGLLYGACFTVPSMAAHRVRRLRSHTGVEHTLTTVGLWLLVVSLVPIAILGTSTLAAPAWLALGAGALSALAGIVGMMRRKLWLRRVREGEIRGWSVELREDRPHDDALRPFAHRPVATCRHVLVRSIDDASPYRADAIPVAFC
jgi:hypothetical protein